ncbi:hypothetical protein [Schinkia azotoformans]|uniref:hypothetical protein n=1 Tax=Schinkia azotoformans TaxID=1454 RepID=UPI002DB58BFA|nr:hypothetical protein [Schinkia azotoformans]MEC1714745.1 hypothetical protein [Schinkia azotoformans]MEC1757499.1 hypothetical protein [Schinkia azotoformans]
MSKLLKWFIGIFLTLVVLVTPIILSQIIRLPFGYLTIGNEDSWVSFFGSYLGGVLGGLVAFGVAWLQINNLRKETLENNRSYLSAATPVRNFSTDKKINRKEKFRVLLTDDFKTLDGFNKEVPYYSVVRFGGSEVIWECEIHITVAKDKDFIKTATLKAWIDFFDKEEEILIPLCSIKLNESFPYIKEITITYRTEKNERIRFYQSEKDLKRVHYLINGRKETIINEMNIVNTSWIER